jgi:hypothetical protein
MLTKTYDVLYRRWLAGEVTTKPLPPSSDALYTNFSTDINKVKSISDDELNDLIDEFVVLAKM